MSFTDFVPGEDEAGEHKLNGGGPHDSGEQFKLVPFDQIQPGKQTGYLIRGVIPRTGITVIWGPPKCGKSFWTFDLVMHSARSLPDYRGCRVVGGPVVYCAFEGQEGFKARVDAYRDEHNVHEGETAFYLVASNAKLVRDNQRLIAAIGTQIGDTAPVAVVLDTLNRSIDGSESRDQDMGAYLDATSAIQQAFGCVVLIVHHCGVDSTRPRGHTSITGTCETQIAVSRDASDNVIAEVEYMKDGASGARFTSRLKLVDIGFDEFGEPRTSCIILEADEPLPAKKKKAKLTPAETMVLRALSEAILDAGQEPPPGANAPFGTKGVDVKVWRERAYRRGISAGQTERARQQAFKRASEKLIAHHQVGVWDEFMWMGSGGEI